MTLSVDEGWMKEMIAGSIRSAIADVAKGHHTTQSISSARSKRFVARLGEALHQTARKTFPYEPDPVRSHYLDESVPGGAGDPGFLWDIFVGQYGSDESGTASALLRGLWAVECEFHAEFQQAFNKLMVAHVDHRLFITPTGNRLASSLQTQCRVGKVSCWVAEVDPLDKWSAEEGYTPWVKVQLIAPGR